MILKEKLQEGRIISIDAFRGVTIFVMIFVNELASKENIPQWLRHMPADADAMSFVDIVFPAFLFIVGMSIPFSFNARLRKGGSFVNIWSHTIKRALALIVMGLFMVNAEYGFNESEMIISAALWGFLAYSLPIPVWNKYSKSFSSYLKVAIQIAGIAGFIVLYFLYIRVDGGRGMTQKWWGILGLIGWAYLFSVIIYWIGRGKLFILVIFFFICVAANCLSDIDSVLLNKFGWFRFISGHLVHTTLVLAGIIISLLFFEVKQKGVMNWPVIIAIVVFFILGFVLRPYFEVSKIRGTPSWTLYSAGICTMVYYVFYILMEKFKRTSWSGFIMPAAENPLLIYILPGIIIYFAQIVGLRLTPELFSNGIAGVAWSIIFSTVMLYIVMGLNKINIRLHL